MKETKIWEKLNKLFKNNNIAASRIENSISVGTPDVEFSINKKCSGWIELKSIHRKVKNRKKINIPYRKGQISWLKNKSGTSNCYVLLYMDNFYFLLNDFQKNYQSMNSFLKHVIWAGDKLDKSLIDTLKNI